MEESVGLQDRDRDDERREERQDDAG